MGKVESDFEILLRERLIKYLVKRVDRNLFWQNEGPGKFNPYSIYEIKTKDDEIRFRYKIGFGYSKNDGLTFRLCNVVFPEKNRRKGILTGMMAVVEEFAHRYKIKTLQVECPLSDEIFAWMKKNRYHELHESLWEKELDL